MEEVEGPPGTGANADATGGRVGVLRELSNDQKNTPATANVTNVRRIILVTCSCVVFVFMRDA
jgi:hypothetical protein